MTSTSARDRGERGEKTGRRTRGVGGKSADLRRMAWTPAWKGDKTGERGRGQRAEQDARQGKLELVDVVGAERVGEGGRDVDRERVDH